MCYIHFWFCNDCKLRVHPSMGHREPCSYMENSNSSAASCLVSPLHWNGGSVQSGDLILFLALTRTGILSNFFASVLPVFAINECCICILRLNICKGPKVLRRGAFVSLSSNQVMLAFNLDTQFTQPILTFMHKCFSCLRQWVSILTLRKCHPFPSIRILQKSKVI